MHTHIFCIKSFASVLQSALVLSEVLKERDAQVEMKRLRKAANAGQDMDWAEKERHEIEEANRVEREKAIQRLRENQETAEFQLAQCVLTFVHFGNKF